MVVFESFFLFFQLNNTHYGLQLAVPQGADNFVLLMAKLVSVPLGMEYLVGPYFGSWAIFPLRLWALQQQRPSWEFPFISTPAYAGGPTSRPWGVSRLRGGLFFLPLFVSGFGGYQQVAMLLVPEGHDGFVFVEK